MGRFFLGCCTFEAVTSVTFLKLFEQKGSCHEVIPLVRDIFMVAPSRFLEGARNHSAPPAQVPYPLPLSGMRVLIVRTTSKSGCCLLDWLLSESLIVKVAPDQKVHKIFFDFFFVDQLLAVSMTGLIYGALFFLLGRKCFLVLMVLQILCYGLAKAPQK
jgi:hypothetical protein